MSEEIMPAAADPPPPPLSCEPADSPLVWICLRTKPRKEQSAARSLRQCGGWEIFAPQVRYRRHTVRGAKWFVEAMFPGYLFVHLDLEQDFRHASHCMWVTGSVRFGQKIATVPTAALTLLRQAYQGQEENPLEISAQFPQGAEMQIAEGPLRGLSCVVQYYLPAKNRVAILVDFLGQQVQTQVEPYTLHPRST